MNSHNRVLRSFLTAVSPFSLPVIACAQISNVSSDWTADGSIVAGLGGQVVYSNLVHGSEGTFTDSQTYSDSGTGAGVTISASQTISSNTSKSFRADGQLSTAASALTNPNLTNRITSSLDNSVGIQFTLDTAQWFSFRLNLTSYSASGAVYPPQNIEVARLYTPSGKVASTALSGGTYSALLGPGNYNFSYQVSPAAFAGASYFLGNSANSQISLDLDYSVKIGEAAAPVPEPATVSVVALGMLALVRRGRRLNQ